MGLLDRFISRTVEKYVLGMIRDGKSEAEYANLVYDAARVYAENNGGKRYPDTPDIISCDKSFDGKNYYLTFMTGFGIRGTSISIEAQPTAAELVEASVKAEMARWSNQ